MEENNKKEMSTIPMLFWVLSSQSFMRISLAGQDDVDVGAPIMQRATVQLRLIALICVHKAYAFALRACELIAQHLRPCVFRALRRSASACSRLYVLRLFFFSNRTFSLVILLSHRESFVSVIFFSVFDIEMHNIYL